MRRLTSFLLAAFLLPAVVAAQSGVIETVAGGGPHNLPALSANLDSTDSVAVDSSGNLYIVSQFQHRVFKVDTSGQLTVVAGAGVPGFRGDGGPATDAYLAFPRSIAVDASGSLFINDSGNARIRRVDTVTGIISTWVSTAQTLGIALDSSGNLYIAETNNHRVLRCDAVTKTFTIIAGNGIAGFSGDGGPATSASLLTPMGVVVDAAGNLYVADANNHRVRRVDGISGIITTVAGNGIASSSGDGGPATSASLAFPAGVALDAGGNLVIADISTHHIRRVDTLTGVITTVAGNGVNGFAGDGGPAPIASLNSPSAVAFDAAGNLLIADNGNRRVRIVDAASGVITTVAGNGVAGSAGDGFLASRATLVDPAGTALDATGNLFIVERGGHRVRRVDAATGIITTVAGNGIAGFGGDGGSATDASLRFPTGLAVDASGNLLIADQVNGRIRRVDAASGIISTVAGGGACCVFDDGVPATSATLARPINVAVDGGGNIFIAEESRDRIRRVDAATGIITTVAGNGTAGFGGDGGPATSARLRGPSAVRIDPAGNLFIADRFNQRVRRVDSVTGFITTVAGNGFMGFGGDGGPAPNARLGNPSGLAIDASGNLFIADLSNQRIRRVEASTGIITTFAGNGLFAFSGDGGPATSAGLAFPSDVVVSGSFLYIADLSNHRIRRVGLSQNEAPAANAGADQAVGCSSPGGTAVMLDASGSSDPDGDALTYTWTGAFPEGGGTVVGVNPTVTLPLGTHTLQLTVSDGVAQSSDSVEVRVGVGVTGFENPLAPLSVEGNSITLPNRAFRQGSTLPLRLQLSCGGTMLGPADVAPPKIVGLAWDAGAIELQTIDLDSGQANDSGILFRFSDGKWVYNLSTKGLAAGTFLITIETPDGLRYTAAFVLR